MVIKRHTFQEVGGFDPDYFAYFEDVDLGWRLNLLGREVWYTPRATAYHRHHGTASSVPDHRLAVLYERNALSTIYKCLAEETLDRVLPVALMLVNERGLTMAGVDRATFAMSPAKPSADAGEPAGPAAPAREPLAARAQRVLREEGFGGVAAKSLRLLRYYVRLAIGNAMLWATARLHPQLFPPPDRFTVVPSVALSQYVAISEFARSLERLKAKRCWLQERRRVSDPQLFALFDDPFFVNYPDERYVHFYRWLTRIQGLDRLFSPPND
jgi:hypothetical protein